MEGQTNKYISTSLERRIQTYLKPRVYMMFQAERGAKLRGESEHAAKIVDKYYEGLPESHQRALVDQYERINKKTT